MNSALIDAYKRLAVTFVQGEGCWLWDKQDKRYLDALSGIGVCALGHCHPRITDTIRRQADTLIHTSNIYQVEAQQLLAEKLCQLSNMEKVFFTNSGAEANECAIKLARLYGHQKGIDEPTIIVMERSFHGRTLATLSATGNRKIQAGFEPLVKGFVRAPFADLEAVRTIAGTNPNVVAVLLEPIQGEGGIHSATTDYLTGIRQLCDQQGWLLMLDEIQSGLCRTGQWFAHQHHEIVPDVLCSAKALGNGIPIGACLARGEAATVIHPGNHGSTFGGNPFACSVAMTVLEVMKDDNLAARAEQQGKKLSQMFSEQIQRTNLDVDIRGQGLMIGLDVKKPCTQLVQQALEKQLLINVTSESVIRLLPPLIIDDALLEKIVNRLFPLIHNHLHS